MQKKDFCFFCFLDTQTVYEVVDDVEVAYDMDLLSSGEGIHVDREGDDGIVESDYDQEDEDIAMDTCVDPTSNWENFQPPEIPRNEDEGESNVSDNIDELVSLDGSEAGDDEDIYVKPPIFSKKKYPEFNSEVDLKDPKFVVGMTFSSASVFREAARAHAVKHRRAVKFEKNDKDKIKAICKALDCKWMVYASWLNSDHKTFKLKTLHKEHSCAMTFRNKVVSTRWIEHKYINHWRANPD
ncbi:hypothetical protein UlMin_005838 [Ulmus minor]